MCLVGWHLRIPSRAGLLLVTWQSWTTLWEMTVTCTRCQPTPTQEAVAWGRTGSVSTTTTDVSRKWDLCLRLLRMWVGNEMCLRLLRMWVENEICVYDYYGCEYEMRSVSTTTTDVSMKWDMCLRLLRMWVENEIAFWGYAWFGNYEYNLEHWESVT